MLSLRSDAKMRQAWVATRLSSKGVYAAAVDSTRGIQTVTSVPC
jgi:hypothetical protein